MRPHGDHRPDDELKKEIYEKWVAPLYDIVGVFDDRKRAVDMWRSLGLTVFHVAEGDY
jgi:hypothetical protein